MLEIDISRDPLVVFTCRRRVDDADVEGFIAEHMRRFALGKPFVIIIHTLQLSMPSVPSLRRLAAFGEKNREDISRMILGYSLAMESALVRGATKFVNQLSPPAAPQEFFATLDEAIAQGIAWCDAAGVAVPQSARAS